MTARTLHAAVMWTDSQQATLERAECFDTSAGLDTVAGMRARGLPLIEVRCESSGAVVALFCWRIVAADLMPMESHGTLEILAMAGESVPGIDAVDAVDEAAERIARFFGVRRIQCMTRRPGLIAALCARRKWEAHATVMRREVSA